MPKPRIRKQGTKMLCETLRYIYDVNIETVRDKNASAKDRKEARATADKARRDGLAWGCTWAERA
jgi:hypothetical protein